MSNKIKKTSGGGSLRTLVFTFMFLVMMATCGIAGYAVWEMSKSAGQSAQQNAGLQAEATVHADPLYQSLNTFTVSLKPTENENDRVLFVGLSLRMADKQSLLTIEKFLPEYRSRLLILLAKSSYEELATHEGKQLLVEKIKHEVTKPLAANQSVKVADVLFNEFILR
ncbi:flagellar basal body-associated protein FliL [Erwinia pyrifoliae]|uniref:Flagellar protein FliL n=1 Tax=Erwinia pyrifoliae TaxID=79967 RepID=A0ABY5XAA9_ERWPY|nr:flagellar basal body-associated protein FliL [Erwinia pyrifoliae]AUX73502.1 flagellar basal body-associated protein FliL [Erwinia pyrifoliae]MCA8876197.1 flagellar basal body-associated protein FliL [Erwinia pyrifoliae]MCT2386338.1 flagellar basal body-associated protein FliL [Erwinia pyrifoliae]MCU8588065.1 flagellar basal body-associated protein FliL [Erwinia pyrifoliae]UWS28466.1 flagellar basal body-associated protein FliL [Erwinia pyrifoliae]